MGEKGKGEKGKGRDIKKGSGREGEKGMGRKIYKRYHFCNRPGAYVISVYVTGYYSIVRPTDYNYFDLPSVLCDMANYPNFGAGRIGRAWFWIYLMSEFGTFIALLRRSRAATEYFSSEKFPPTGSFSTGICYFLKVIS